MSVATVHPSHASPRDDRLTLAQEVQQGIKHFFSIGESNRSRRSSFSHPTRQASPPLLISAPTTRASHSMEQTMIPYRSLPPRPAGPVPPQNRRKNNNNNGATTTAVAVTKSHGEQRPTVDRILSDPSTASNSSAVVPPVVVRPQSEPLVKFTLHEPLHSSVEGRSRAGTAEKKPPPHSSIEELLLNPTSSPSVSKGDTSPTRQIPTHIHVLGIKAQTQDHMAIMINRANPNKDHDDDATQGANLIQESTSPTHEHQEHDNGTTEISMKIDGNKNPTSGNKVETSQAATLQRENSPTLITSEAVPQPTSAIRTSSSSSDTDGVIVEQGSDTLTTTSLESSFGKSFLEGQSDRDESGFHMALVDDYLDLVATSSSSSSSSSLPSSLSATSPEVNKNGEDVKMLDESEEIVVVTDPPTPSLTTTSSPSRRLSFLSYFTSNKEQTPTVTTPQPITPTPTTPLTAPTTTTMLPSSTSTITTIRVPETATTTTPMRLDDSETSENGEISKNEEEEEEFVMV